jgi:hypothetical protein
MPSVKEGTARPFSRGTGGRLDRLGPGAGVPDVFIACGPPVPRLKGRIAGARDAVK